MLPHPLRRLQAYVEREQIANKLFSPQGSVYLQASLPAIPSSLPRYGGAPEVIQPVLFKLISGLKCLENAVDSNDGANVGKSTIINQVFKKRRLASVGQTPGSTQSLNFYRCRGTLPELILVDAPGYGARGRPGWGKLFDYYIRNRKELRLVFIVINTEHGVTDYDKLMFENLEMISQSRGFKIQPILSKCDALPRLSLPQLIARRQQSISECSPSSLPAIPTGAGSRGIFGFQDVRHSILEACGLSKPLEPP